MVNYPNGEPYHSKHDKKSRHLQVKPKTMTYSNRGMTLERMINASIKYYRETGQAVLHKKPTPVQIVNVDYPRRSAAKITEAYFKRASTTDYNGVYRGYYLDFEAKETKNKTSFPLSNFHEHQIRHMQHCLEQGGIVFVLVYFSHLRQLYLLDAQYFIDYWEDHLAGGRKSIPLTIFEAEGYPISLGYAPQIPFLQAVDEFISTM